MMNNTSTFDQLLAENYGKQGSPVRDKFDADSIAFRLGIMRKEDRIKAILTQKALSIKTDKKI